jgi:hypothetical protein
MRFYARKWLGGQFPRYLCYHYGYSDCHGYVYYDHHGFPRLPGESPATQTTLTSLELFAKVKSKLWWLRQNCYGKRTCPNSLFHVFFYDCSSTAWTGPSEAEAPSTPREGSAPSPPSPPPHWLPSSAWWSASSTGACKRGLECDDKTAISRSYGGTSQTPGNCSRDNWRGTRSSATSTSSRRHVPSAPAATSRSSADPHVRRKVSGNIRTLTVFFSNCTKPTFRPPIRTQDFSIPRDWTCPFNTGRST